jgi:hypothetical protein
MHIAQLFVLIAGAITAFGLFSAVREFITDTLEDYRNSKL